ncbi:bifunctional diaminohydroxyphosphoribosylaminopyrimidine deaminase/5-amino-6-(5-phosphoribosylamino)uracil reductase RibD [Spongiimicrobium sp. 3-5]|uniref:bifunctional diaminohydroxyphosphoribosylaminopyrimidine deaminase/5-amino-6-(5-phosphoribosylamino)uracil reductase RibD n=1 Tax=Spongiimicrobium sp. 3-5 TaxID=3332596 RepID=UPI00397F0896
MKIHEKYILRCIQLAKNGVGTTFPNPMVGSIIVHKGRIIGEGFTSPYGGAHAEVNAINSVKDQSLLKEATLYVTLEPCSHFGKTPPCADLIVRQGIPNVIIGTLDPNSKVAGKGVKKLRESGCNVIVGVIEGACREHHRRFLTFYEKKRPYFLLKWAQTEDGFIAPEHTKRNNDPQPYWISGVRSRQLVHQWRSEEQAILVGTNTVIQDNPKLDVRHWHGNSPTRIILDRDLKIDARFNVYNGKAKTIIVTGNENIGNNMDNVDYVGIDFSQNVIKQLCEVLYAHKILSVLVEGGAQTLQTFITAGIWDEARVFIGKSNFGKGLKAPILTEHPVNIKNIDGDALNIYRND